MKKGTPKGAFCIGGEEGDRTLDLRIANATLSQLSYFPNARILAKALADFSPRRCQDTGSGRPILR